MPTLKAIKKKVARKLRSAKKSVRKLTVRFNKLKRKTLGKKKKRRTKRRTKKGSRKRRTKKGSRKRR
jgi:hypothetical protein